MTPREASWAIFLLLGVVLIAIGAAMNNSLLTLAGIIVMAWGVLVTQEANGG